METLGLDSGHHKAHFDRKAMRHQAGLKLFLVTFLVLCCRAVTCWSYQYRLEIY